jgi:hypothetical protein
VVRLLLTRRIALLWPRLPSTPWWPHSTRPLPHLHPYKRFRRTRHPHLNDRFLSSHYGDLRLSLVHLVPQIFLLGVPPVLLVSIRFHGRVSDLCWEVDKPPLTLQPQPHNLTNITRLHHRTTKTTVFFTQSQSEDVQNFRRGRQRSDLLDTRGRSYQH